VPRLLPRHTGAVQLDRGGLAGGASPSSLGHRVAQGMDGGASSQVPLFDQAGGVPLHRASVSDIACGAAVSATRGGAACGDGFLAPFQGFMLTLKEPPALSGDEDVFPADCMKLLSSGASSRGGKERRSVWSHIPPTTTYCRRPHQ